MRYPLPRLSRRQLLTLMAGTTGAVLLTQCRGQGRSPVTNTETDTVTDTELMAQAVERSADGLLQVRLEAAASQLNVAGQEIPIFTYNGQFPPPRLEASPGDRVRIEFHNRLDEPTNLHFHGLHIPPTGNADNTFLEVAPGGSQRYEFTIPEDHPAGTFFYHPHYHGWVAHQVLAGLGGLFVIRGDLDEIQEVQQATEQFVILKDFATDFRDVSGGHMAMMAGREGEFVTVNGEIRPSWRVPNGELLRLRFVNTSNARFYNLALDDRPFYLIATDGGAIAQPRELSELLLSPGERADVLVRGDEGAASVNLVNRPYSRGRMGGGMMGNGGGMGRMGRGRMGRMGGRESDEAEVLATISYDGDPVSGRSLPRQLRPVDTLPEPSQTRRFVFNHGMARGQGMVFLINGKTFDGDRTDVQVQLGQVEDWEIVNEGMFDHPFHLHTNPFQVMSRNGQPERDRAWKDVVLVKAGETVRLRTRFQDFPGRTMYHCHILDHEDQGMMGIVEMQA
ncbi:MAG: multicopper oxidase family protein [Sodalinema sp.]|uniref:multicopper oxidase family protein n=1 Tax=Sodalinema sp. TaxID=3080550 RepID=UPI00396F535A